MDTKLREGHVVRCAKFAVGIMDKTFNRIEVGDFSHTDLVIGHNSEPLVDESRACSEYVITGVKEDQPHLTIGNCMSSYENRIYAKRLNDDGTWDDNGEEIIFSTCYVYRGSIREDDIEIVRTMKKTFV